MTTHSPEALCGQGTHPAPCPPPAVFPMIGNIFSIHWKTAENFFQSLEKTG